MTIQHVEAVNAAAAAQHAGGAGGVLGASAPAASCRAAQHAKRQQQQPPHAQPACLLSVGGEAVSEQEQGAPVPAASAHAPASPPPAGALPHAPQPAATPYCPPRLRSGSAADQGRRGHMEDASVAYDDVIGAWRASLTDCRAGVGAAPGAFDGHGPAGAGPAATAGGAGSGDAPAAEAAAAAAATPQPDWPGAGAAPAASGFYAVFDGHCGAAAAQFAAARAFGSVVGSRHFPLDPEAAMADAILSIEEEYAASVSGGRAAAAGTTALAALVWGGTLVVANAGDSRAVLSRRGKAIDLTTDHKPAAPAERLRIESCGGFVCEDGLLCGELAVARAIGDWHLADLKRPSLGGRPGTPAWGPLTAEPEVRVVALEGPGDEFLLLGCDGLWDVFSSQRAVEFARQRLRAHNCARRCAEELVAEALRMHSSDNLTVIVICLGEDAPQPRVYSGSALSSRRASADGSRRVSEAGSRRASEDGSGIPAALAAAAAAAAATLTPAPAPPSPQLRPRQPQHSEAGRGAASPLPPSSASALPPRHPV